MADHRIPVASDKDSTAPPLVIVQHCAPGDDWTIDMVDSIMRHVPVGDLRPTQLMQRAAAIVTTELSFNAIRRHAFLSAWKDWVDHYNSGENKLRILVQDAYREDFYCLFGPPGADVVIEITVFDRYFFGLNDGVFKQGTCGQQLLRWDAFFTTVFSGCETTLTIGSSLKDWLAHSVSLTEQSSSQQKVTLLSGHEVIYYRLYAPLSKAC